MLSVTGAAMLLRLITTSVADLDVYAAFVDLNVSTEAISAGDQLTAIASATTTTIVSPAGANSTRAVETLYITNTHATISNTVTLEVFDGANGFRVTKQILPAGWALKYDEGAGLRVFDSNGNPMVSENSNGIQPTVNSLTTVVLGADVTNNNGTANTIADVTGLSFSVVAGNKYKFRAVINYTAAATTTGSRWSVNGPGSPTQLSYCSKYALTTTTETLNNGLAAYDLPAASNATSAATGGNVAVVEGIIQPSANGTVVIRFASEISGSAIVAKAGSFLEWMQVA
jgi:hypothetical protein